MVQRAVNKKAKASLKSTIMVWDLDIHCSQSHCLFNNTILKVQTQRITAKDYSRLEKPKTKDLKSAFLHGNIVELAKKKNKQKKFKCWRKCTRKSKETPATSNNIVNATKKKKSVTLVKSYVLIVIKKVTLPAIIPSQKTSVDLDNLRSINW